MRAAVTFEQCWHRVPGGTAVAALETARATSESGETSLVGVAGRHRRPPARGFEPPIPTSHLPIGGPLLYESWLRLQWPKVESVVDVDVVHSTTIIPAATSLPHAVTIHDLAFLRHPEYFTARGNSVFRRSLRSVGARADVVLCSSLATLGDCVDAGIPQSRLRHVPLGVRPVEVVPGEIERVRASHGVPSEFLLFVGTLEPRKNLERLVEALATVDDAPPLVVVGARGWGDEGAVPPAGVDVRFLGHVPEADLHPLYAAATVFCYPSVMEGFGLPVLEAMSHGTPVVTSRGTSTEEVAGGAAVLVDPFDVDSIADGVRRAITGRDGLVAGCRRRAVEMTWDATAAATVAVYREIAR